MSSSAERLVTVVGVRPQFVRLKALRYLARQFNLPPLLAVDTGQHHDAELRGDAERVVPVRTAEPNDLMSTAAAVAEVISALEPRPDGLLAMGDANPAAIAALAGLSLDLPVVHVESGARRALSEAEDRNSRLVAAIATASCASTPRGLSNLMREGYGARSSLVGDLALPWFKLRYSEVLAAGDLSPSDSILVTVHRPYNSESCVLTELASALGSLKLPVTWVTHPRNRQVVEQVTSRWRNIIVLPSLNHSQLVSQIVTHAVVLTDSGGIIRECHHLRKRVGVLRQVGGWDELIEMGLNVRISSVDLVPGCSMQLLALARTSYPATNLFEIAEGPALFVEVVRKALKGGPA